ncbi:hypothetical protein BCh11DRAFT_07565 [Burkholderia sp. Ch1-1]|nr:hypothetical protein BCh11DRAFT_07565 [Burkholderia sp. Ch1-1]
MQAGKLAGVGLALALCAYGPGASAQSSVTLFGGIDEGLTYVTNEGGGHNALVGPAAAPDFFGVMGTEDLGGGYKAFFKLQQGFSSNTGASVVANDMFSWQSYVGLTTPLGSASLGKQFDLVNDALEPNANGVLQFSYYLYHPGNLDDAGWTSVNNAIKYTSPTVDGVTVSALYGMDDGTTQLGRVLDFDVIYDQGPLRASAVYSSWHDHQLSLASKLGYTSFLGESLNNGATFLAKDTNIYAVSARYKWPVVMVHGMFTHVTIDGYRGTANMNTGELGVNVPTSAANAITLGGFYSSLTGTHYVEAGVGNLYSLSRRTLVYAQAVYEHASGIGNASMALLTPSNTPSQAAFRIGIHHFF